MFTISIPQLKFAFLAALMSLAVSFGNASEPEATETGALERVLVSFHWKWLENGVVGQRDADFNPDGQLRNPGGAGVTHYRWQVTGRRSFTLTSKKGVSYFSANEELTQFDGEHAGTHAHITGKRLGPVTEVATSPKSESAETPVTNPPPASTPPPVVSVPSTPPPTQVVISAAAVPPAISPKLDELRDHASTMKESLLAPLEQPVAEDLKGYVGSLREDILDEASRKPAAGRVPYNLAVQICNTFAAVDEERTATLVRLNNNLPSNAKGKADVKKVHPSWAELAREQAEAARVTQNNTLETTFHKQIRVQWGLRAIELGKIMDAEIAQFRTALRQIPSLK